jgi:Fur family ferric uptake transcriptional regulator
LKEKGLLYSYQREQILVVFVKIKNHPTVDDIYNTIRKKNPKIGLATVYRTMRVICDCGMAMEVDFGDGVRRFEHKYRHQHRHHLVCIKCGKVIEVTSGRIESLQKKLAKQHNFAPTKDTMKIFGLCSKCKNKQES